MKTSLLKIGFYFLLSAFLFLNSNANAQGIINLKDDKAVDNTFGDDYLYFVGSVDYTGKSVNSQLRLELESQLKAGLAKQIISKISVVNNAKFSQISFNNNSNKTKNLPSEVMKYEFSTDIESKLSFSNPIIRYQNEVGEKKLYGLIAVAKKEFIEQNFTKLKFELSILSDKLDNVLEGSNSNTRVNQKNIMSSCWIRITYIL